MANKRLGLEPVIDAAARVTDRQISGAFTEATDAGRVTPWMGELRMSIKAIVSAVIVLSGCLAFGYAAPASAQYCEGRVHGLSGRYNLATGSGFLAVRARPSANARMVGQLFNGDTAEIFDRRGNWYRIAIGGIDGWANRKWMRNSCGF